MKKKLTKEFVSLNGELYTEFSVQKLELRLETDPLLFVDFFQQELMEDGIVCTNPGALRHCGQGDVLTACSYQPESLVAG
jgi:hypothetical protein